MAAMDPSRIPTRTLIIRLWQEVESNGLPIWRGSIYRSPDGKERYFQSLEMLLEILQSTLNDPSKENEP